MNDVKKAKAKARAIANKIFSPEKTQERDALERDIYYAIVDTVDEEREAIIGWIQDRGT